MKTSAIIEKLREIILALPEVEESIKWGEPHPTVRGKIFCGWGIDDDDEGNRIAHVGFKLEKPHAHILCEERENCSQSKYVGKHGWVTMLLRESDPIDWDEMRAFLHESYRLIAPKSLSKLV